MGHVSFYCPYDPAWQKVFAKEAQVIQEALDCCAIQHVGSTSVPGLMAKPKIDILAVIPVDSNSISLLESIGFVWKGEWNLPFQCGFTKRGSVHVNLYVWKEHHPEIQLNLLVRDYCRSQADTCQEYAALKALLVSERAYRIPGPFFSANTTGKDDFLRKILQATGFQGLRLLHCAHEADWEDYHRLRKEHNIFDPLGVPYDLHRPSLTENTAFPKNHFHLVLVEGATMVAAAHVELLQGDGAAL